MKLIRRMHSSVFVAIHNPRVPPARLLAMRWGRISIRLAIFSSIVVCLYAQSETRVRESFDAGWLFERQSTGSGALGSFDRDTTAAAQVEPRFRDAIRAAYDDSSWQRVHIPHTWN